MLSFFAHKTPAELSNACDSRLKLSVASNSFLYNSFCSPKAHIYIHSFFRNTSITILVDDTASNLICTCSLVGRKPIVSASHHRGTGLREPDRTRPAQHSRHTAPWRRSTLRFLFHNPSLSRVRSQSPGFWSRPEVVSHDHGPPRRSCGQSRR